MIIDCTTCKYGYEDEQLGIPMCHHPKRFSEDCVDFNMHEEKMNKEITNDLLESKHTMAVQLPDGRYVTEELARQMAHEGLDELVNSYLEKHRHDLLLSPYNGLMDFVKLVCEWQKKPVEGLDKAAEEYTHVGATNDIKELGNTPADKGYQPSGISKAEDAAMQAYPNMTFPFTPLDLNAYRRGAFIQGYQQAEKDLALTWEDVQLLHIITEKYMRELDNRIEAYPSSSQELFEEVLRRFNERKK